MVAKTVIMEAFFKDQIDYFNFFHFKNVVIRMNDDVNCIAELKKEKGVFLFTLTWIEDGMFIGEHVKPFEPSIINIEKFNQGCKILADRLSSYIIFRDINAIPDHPPAFGDLSVVMDQ